MESFIHLVDDYEESHLSYITAVDQKKQKLKIFKSESDKRIGHSAYKVSF